LTPLTIPPLSPSLPILHLATSHYPPKFATTPHFTPGHIQLYTQFCHHFQFHHWAHQIALPLSSPLPISHLGTFNLMTHTISPPLPISHLGTSGNPPTLSTTPNFTTGQI
jgi:hypothetical protein